MWWCWRFAGSVGFLLATVWKGVVWRCRGGGGGDGPVVRVGCDGETTRGDGDSEATATVTLVAAMAVAAVVAQYWVVGGNQNKTISKQAEEADDTTVFLVGIE